jgi:hypothetical protein
MRNQATRKGLEMRKTDWLVVAVLALCALGLVACGGGGGSGSGGGGEAAAREEAGLEFAECMRAHGVEMEDPKAGQESIAIGGDPNDPGTKRAEAACNGKLDKVAQESSPEEDEEFREGWLAFTECMRGEGIELADPTFEGPGKVRLGIAGVDTESPAFDAAREACEGKVPDTGGFGVGG